MPQYKYYRVNTENLIPELTLAQPVYTNDMALLANKDTNISWALITKLKSHNIVNVLVYETSYIDELAHEIVYDNGESISIESNKNADILDSDVPTDYKVCMEKFKQNYMANITNVKYLFEDIQNSDKLDTEEILNLCDDCLEMLPHKGDIFTFLNAIESKDNITYRHSYNVSLICNVFGHWLKMSRADIEMLTLAGLLHDIGKLQIENTVLNKVDPLTDLEFAIIKTHVLKSYKIVSKYDIPEPVKQGILMHHERLDGSGYMTGAKNYQINFIARLIAIADMYDALTKDKPYRKKYSPLNVLYYLQSLITSLDVSLINTLTYKIGKSFEGKRAKLNTDEICTIVHISKSNINKPLINLNGKLIDLSQNKDFFIRSILTD